MQISEPVIQWLLETGDPSIRYFTLTDLLDLPADSQDVTEARNQILSGARVQTLLSGQGPDGGFGGHPYKKWDGAHWRLVSLVELGIPPGEPAAVAAAGQVLDWLTGAGHRKGIRSINGLTRRCASQEGNALAACSRLGLAADARVELLARSLVEWQWPDGGWNCDKTPTARHSSFYESLSPMWGLIEYSHATGDASTHEAACRAGELFLSHRLFRSDHSGEVINAEWLKLHYPLYWRYDILQALLILSRLGPLSDPRITEALDLLEARRLPDGGWQAEGFFWSLAPSKPSGREVVNWGRKGPNAMITLNALRVLRSAGRLN